MKEKLLWDEDAEIIFEQVKEAMANVSFVYHHFQDAEFSLITECINFASCGVLQ